MFSRVNWIYLAACTVLASVQFSRVPPTHLAIATFLWAIAAFTYPLSLALTHSGLRFWRGILTILLIVVIAHLVELGMILEWEHGGILHPDWLTVRVFAFYWTEPAATVIIWFLLGYLATRFLPRRKVD